MLQKYSICSHYSNRKKNYCKSASIFPIQPGSEASEAKKLHFCRNFLIMSEKPGKKLHFCRIPSNQCRIIQKSSIYLHSTSIPPYPPYDPTLPHSYHIRKETNSLPNTRTASAKKPLHIVQHSYRIRKETNSLPPYLTRICKEIASSPHTHSAITPHPQAQKIAEADSTPAPAILSCHIERQAYASDKTYSVMVRTMTPVAPFGSTPRPLLRKAVPAISR